MFPDEAVLHITSCCSHHCPFCYYIDDNIQPFSQDYNILKKIVDELVKYGCKSILFVGGDPVMHPNIINLGKYAKSLGMTTSILSNTLEFKLQDTELNVAAAFDSIEVTIHNSEPELHDAFCGKKGAFFNVIKNFKIINTCVGEDVHLGIAYNITPYTYQDIYKVVNRIVNIEGIRLDHIVFQRIVPIGRAINNMDWSLSHQNIFQIFSQMEKIEEDFSINIYLEDSFPLCVVPIQYRRFVHRCHWGNSGISIDLYGNISKCCTDSRYTIGNILETSLVDIWNSSLELIKRRKGELVPEKCRQCLLYMECGGGCILASELNNCNGDPLMTMATIQYELY